MKAQQLKNAILQLAIQGKLVPQDPNDEPASVLLEKIKQEKEKLIAEGKIKKSKKTADNSPYTNNEEIPFEIPESWVWVRLGEIILNNIGGGTPAKSVAEYWNGDIPWASVKDLDKDCIYLNNTIDRITREGLEHSSSNMIGKGNIILCTRMGLGKVAINNIDVAINQDLRGIELSSKLAQLYFIYFYKTLSIQGQGLTVKGLTVEQLHSILFPLPPLAEQKRIVAKIEELLPFIEQYAKKEQELTALHLAFPEQLKKSILQAAIQGKLTEQNPNDEPAIELVKRIQTEKERLILEKKIKKPKQTSEIVIRDNLPYEMVNGVERCIADEIPFAIPESWCWVRLGEIGNWGSGATPNRHEPKYYLNGTIPWLKTGDLNDDQINDVSEYISELALKETSVRLNPIGSVLIAMYGATIGKLGILNIVATTNQACCACIPYNEVLNKYLFYYLMSQKSEFQKRSEGSGQPNISKEKIINHLFPLPPLEEQKRIVTKIENLFSIVENLK